MTSDGEHLKRLARGATAVVFVLSVVAGGCKREERVFRVSSPAVARQDGVRLSTLEPGGPSPHVPKKNPYEDNAQALAEGQRLFSAYNCTGCHANGGGSIGPPLLDEKWRYGSEPEQVVASILDGRPNGMPSFRGKLPEDQAWRLAGFVRSLSGLVPKDAAPARSEHMKSSPPSNSVDPVKEVKAEQPPPPN